jgi:hypothetical protein
MGWWPVLRLERGQRDRLGDLGWTYRLRVVDEELDVRRLK